ncbi:hypothetical protein L4A40_27115 [Bacillus cereus]|uniref:hypothetical protein n=1 Tax=Bacillus cereus TaxID=1396 RepID=UPI001F0E1AF5|nr:hypothetical protein [Bacillus cereus]MCH5476759.1 hypothetical protein [Bacillus cereus]
MRVEFEKVTVPQLQEGDIVVMRWTHQPYEWVGVVSKHNESSNAYLHGMDGKTSYYRTRGFKRVSELEEHIRTSSSVKACNVFSQEEYTMAINKMKGNR